MARAAVIPGVSATDQPQKARGTRGRPRTATTAAATTTAGLLEDTKKGEPAKRGRKPGKSTTTTTTTKTRTKKKEQVVARKDEDDEEDDDLCLDMTPSTTAVNARPPRTAVVKTATQGNGFDEDDDDDDDELAVLDVPTTKTARAKGKTATATSQAAGRPTRGRPKGAAAEKESATTAKKTRGRKPAAAKQATDKTIYITTASTSSSLAKARTIGDPAKKKKVTFADLADSETESSAEEEERTKTVARGAGKKTGPKPGGLKAKPVRKAGRPPKSQTTAAAAAAKPLSPKKATQLAKASASLASSGEEDELASEKDIYSLVAQRSPVRTTQEHTGLSSPVKKIMLPGQVSTPARPASRQDENSVLKPLPPSALRDPAAAFMGSPARRPPSSPSKETIRDTPRRGPLFINHPSASNLSSNPEASTCQQKLSPLKASPRKGGHLGASFLSTSPEKAVGGSSGTPFNSKLSLLRSPAKRVQSPFIFRKLDTNEPLVTETARAVDTEMADDTFVVKEKPEVAEPVPSVVDEISDDEPELSMEMKPDNDIHDVFVDNASSVNESVEHDDHEDIPDAEVDHNSQEGVESVEGFIEHGVDAANEHAANDSDCIQQPCETVDEDVIMSSDELPASDENADAEESTEAPEVVDVNEDVENRENIAEPEEITKSLAPEYSEKCDSPAKNAETGDNLTCEAVEQTESTDPTENDSNHIVIYAESESEPEDDVPEVETPRSNTTLTSARSSIDPRDVIGAEEIEEADEIASRSAKTPRFIPPAAPSPPVASPRRSFRMSFRDNHNEDTYSEYGSSPASRRQSTFSRRESVIPRAQSDSADDTFSSLAAKLSAWKASSPEKTRKKTPERSIFSPVVPSKLATPRQSTTPRNRYSQIQTMRHSLAARHSLANSVVMDDGEPDTLSRQPSQESAAASEQVAAKPSKDDITQTEQEKSNPRLSMSITPVRLDRDPYRTVHTVSKVPLRPEGDESPIKYPRKRARSMSIDIELPIRAAPSRLKLVPKTRKSSASRSPSPSSKRSPLKEVEPEVRSPAPASSPAKTTSATPRKDPKVEEQVLRGAVVFVDVHTTEGEDASGIFIELLTQMGAKCVKSWGWNPRASNSPGADGTEPVNTSSKVGITHVVYKDGGVRTLEKVRQAGDLVRCVGVGWVLEYDPCPCS